MRFQLFSVLLLFLSAFSLLGNNDHYQAYITNDLDSWASAVETDARVYEQTQEAALLLSMAKGAYGAIGACFAQEDKKAAADWADRAEGYVKDYLKEVPKSAEAKALLAGIYGMQIGLRPMRGMTLGPKSGRLLSEAVSLDENCALAYYVMGTSAYSTPETWGGSKTKALEHFTKARELYEAQGKTTGNWEYLSVLAWQGMNQHSLEQYTQAQITYQKALETEAEFGWVKYVLLPKTEAILASND